MGSMTCPQCGAVNPAGTKFCSGCGLSLTQKLRQSAPLNPLPTGAIPSPTGSGTSGTQGIGTGAAPTVARGAGQSGVPPQGVVAQALTGQIGLQTLGPGVTLQSGRYVIDRALGAGGMGSVYLASDTHVNNKRVVIKEMANVYATEAERREAETDFQAEMATLAGLSHPNIPQISDFFTESNRHFAVQEYVTGEDLQKAIQAAQAAGQPPRGLPEKQVLGWVSQALSVLDYLEQQDPQVIHRDIKPANIIVDAANRVRVVDFGIASHKYRPGSSPQAGQQVSTALGTPGYAPREQFTGQETPLSDLYALGATTHHLLTGRDPTKTQPLFAYPPMRTLNPKISEPTERIVARALQNDPPKRYQSAMEMKRDIDRVLNPPGALDTFRGRAIAALVVLLLLVGAGGGAYVYSQAQGHERPTGSLSARGEVAFDTNPNGLAALGVSAADGHTWANDKVQASKDMANGNVQSAIGHYNDATTLNQADAESAIYLENNAVLSSGKPYIAIAVGGSFSQAADGSADNTSVGRQDLQGAYTAQKEINDAGGVKGYLLYLVLADDNSTVKGAQGAAAKAQSWQDSTGTGHSIMAMIGFAWSARTKASLPYISGSGIPQIAPTASYPGLNGSPYFYRTCPSDTQQAQYGLNYLLSTLLAGKANPKIAVFGDPKDAYAGGLQGIITTNAAGRATVLSEDYTIGQSDFSRTAQDIKNQGVQGVYFAGYAAEALQLSKAMDAAGVPASVPIMTDDGFYDPASFSDPRYAGVPKGRFHFTTYFFPDLARFSGLSGANQANIARMETAYSQNFHKPGSTFGGYGTSRVSADAALYYDAVKTLGVALNFLKPGAGVTRISVQAALNSIGTITPDYNGISGHIRYVTPVQPLTGDPINKAMVVLHLDAAQGRSHLDAVLGKY